MMKLIRLVIDGKFWLVNSFRPGDVTEAVERMVKEREPEFHDEVIK